MVQLNLGTLGVHEAATKTYRYGRFNYLDKRDNIRHILHTHVLKKTDINDDMAGTAEVFYGEDPVPLIIEFGQSKLRRPVLEALQERWPSLQERS